MNKAARNEVHKNPRKQRNQVAEWYGSMKTSLVDAQGHMNNGFSDAYQTLGMLWKVRKRIHRTVILLCNAIVPQDLLCQSATI